MNRLRKPYLSHHRDRKNRWEAAMEGRKGKGRGGKGGEGEGSEVKGRERKGRAGREDSAKKLWACCV